MNNNQTPEKRYTLEFSESEMWVISTALFEYSRNPINEEHGNIASKIYQSIKSLILGYILS